MTKFTAAATENSRVDDYRQMDPAVQQAYYRICSAIALTQPVSRTSLNPNSQLEVLFPASGRRQKIKAFQRALGVEFDLLKINGSLEWAILISVAASMMAPLISWSLTISCLAFTAMVGWLAGTFGQELKYTSIRQLSEQVALEHYSKTGSHLPPANENDINAMLDQLFDAKHQRAGEKAAGIEAISLCV